jgi:glycine cleavage system H lipoate-binding protein
MGMTIQKLVASAGGQNLRITKNEGATGPLYLIGTDGSRILYTFPDGSDYEEVDLLSLGDSFIYFIEGEFEFDREDTSTTTESTDNGQSLLLKQILFELKKKLALLSDKDEELEGLIENLAEALIQESTSRQSAVTSEELARISAISAEATARTTAIAGEATARNSAIATAIAGEETARNSAIASEATARTSAIATATAGEVTARNSAIASEATARTSAIATAIAGEVTARNSAIASEATARTTAIASEATARTTAIASEATARTTAIATAVAGVKSLETYANYGNKTSTYSLPAFSVGENRLVRVNLVEQGSSTYIKLPTGGTYLLYSNVTVVAGGSIILTGNQNTTLYYNGNIKRLS